MRESESQAPEQPRLEHFCAGKRGREYGSLGGRERDPKRVTRREEQ